MSLYCWPTLPLRGYSIQKGCGYLDPEYFRLLKQVHPGVDLNGRGGGNTDWHDPIYSVGDGTVTHARNHRVWGNVAVIQHATPDGTPFWAQYAHLERMDVTVGQQVAVGQQIGTMGRGNLNSQGKYTFFSHLHFEIRTVNVPGDEWPSAKYPDRAQAEAYIRKTRKDPAVFLNELGAVESLEALQEARARLLTPAEAVPLGPDVPGNWYPVRDAATGQPFPGEWVSIVMRGDVPVVVRVDRFKLKERGIPWE